MARRKDSPQKLGKSFGKAEDNAFINGTGADELTGILHHTAVYDAQRSPFCFRTAVFRSQRPPIFS